MLLTKIMDEAERGLAILLQDDIGLILIAEFPASEAIRKYGPRFGDHPDDRELVTVIIKDGKPHEFQRMPRFGLPILGTAGPHTRLGPAKKETSKRAIGRLKNLISWAISSGRITGKLAQDLAAALGLKVTQ